MQLAVCRPHQSRHVKLQLMNEGCSQIESPPDANKGQLYICLQKQQFPIDPDDFKTARGPKKMLVQAQTVERDSGGCIYIT